MWLSGIYSNIESCPTKLWKYMKALGVGKTGTVFPFNVELNALNNYFAFSPVRLDSVINASGSL